MRWREITESNVSWAPSKGRSVVWVDTHKIDASWSKDPEFYVAQGGQGGIGKRYDRFGEFMQTGQAIEMPDVTLDYQGNTFFENGRHRFRWMLDHGAKAIPICVPEEQKEEIEKRFGTSLRSTSLEQ